MDESRRIARKSKSSTRLAESRRRVESGDGFSLRAQRAAPIAAWHEGNSQRAHSFDAIN
jgi:hypothetical protein